MRRSSYFCSHLLSELLLLLLPSFNQRRFTLVLYYFAYNFFKFFISIFALFPIYFSFYFNNLPLSALKHD